MLNEQPDIALMFDELGDVIHRWMKRGHITDEQVSDLLPWIHAKWEKEYSDGKGDTEEL